MREPPAVSWARRGGSVRGGTGRGGGGAGEQVYRDAAQKAAAATARAPPSGRGTVAARDSLTRQSAYNGVVCWSARAGAGGRARHPSGAQGGRGAIGAVEDGRGAAPPAYGMDAFDWDAAAGGGGDDGPSVLTRSLTEFCTTDFARQASFDLTRDTTDSLFKKIGNNLFVGVPPDAVASVLPVAVVVTADVAVCPAYDAGGNPVCVRGECVCACLCVCVRVCACARALYMRRGEGLFL